MFLARDRYRRLPTLSLLYSRCECMDMPTFHRLSILPVEFVSLRIDNTAMFDYTHSIRTFSYSSEYVEPLEVKRWLSRRGRGAISPWR